MLGQLQKTCASAKTRFRTLLESRFQRRGYQPFIGKDINSIFTALSAGYFCTTPVSARPPRFGRNGFVTVMAKKNVQIRGNLLLWPKPTWTF